jgi:hypothetical protein
MFATLLVNATATWSLRNFCLNAPSRCSAKAEKGGDVEMDAAVQFADSKAHAMEEVMARVLCPPINPLDMMFLQLECTLPVQERGYIICAAAACNSLSTLSCTCHTHLH